MLLVIEEIIILGSFKKKSLKLKPELSLKNEKFNKITKNCT
jgi:hypothetical protein